MTKRFSRRLFFKKAGKVAGAAAVASVLPLPEAIAAPVAEPEPVAPSESDDVSSLMRQYQQGLIPQRMTPGNLGYHTISDSVTVSTSSFPMFISTCSVGRILMSPPTIKRVQDDWDHDDWEDDEEDA